MMFKPYRCKLWPISLFLLKTFPEKSYNNERGHGSVTQVTFLTFTTTEILVTALRMVYQIPVEENATSCIVKTKK